MDSKAKLFGHPLHQMIIVFPLGLLTTSTVFDAIGRGTGDRRWSRASYYILSAGVISAVASAIPGLIDYLAIPKNTRAKRIGLLHGIGNVLVSGMFAWSWSLRGHRRGRPPAGAISLSIGGTLIALFTGWLGGELVDTLGIGVRDDANFNAPSSLSASRRVLPHAG